MLISFEPWHLPFARWTTVRHFASSPTQQYCDRPAEQQYQHCNGKPPERYRESPDFNLYIYTRQPRVAFSWENYAVDQASLGWLDMLAKNFWQHGSCIAKKNFNTTVGLFSCFLAITHHSSSLPMSPIRLSFRPTGSTGRLTVWYLYNSFRVAS